jgi:MFS family permease
MSITREHATLWSPLRVPLFRRVFIADLVSDIGTFMQSVGAAWLMVALGADAAMVALTQTASSLPFFLFALPAGALGDCWGASGSAQCSGQSSCKPLAPDGRSK